MTKTEKKLDNQLRQVLTQVCDTALKEFNGFEWLTHTVNYANFPASLKIICVFDNNEQLEQFRTESGESQFIALIQSGLQAAGVKLKKPAAHIKFDSEQNCLLSHNGNWAARLNQ